jgi:hypothetical protein
VARALPRELLLTREQLVTHVALLRGSHRHHLRLGVHTRADGFRLLARRVDVVPRDCDLRRDVLVLLRDRAEVVDAVERVLIRVRLENHLDERRIVRLVQIDHSQVQLV